MTHVIENLLKDMAFSATEVEVLTAAVDLIHSLQVDHTSSSDEGDSYMALGNVQTKTLQALGFDVPKDEPPSKSIHDFTDK